jgi:Protein of unknown function (DUF3631)
LWRVATPRGAANEPEIACHVIQRERPQPKLAVWTRPGTPASPSGPPRRLYGLSGCPPVPGCGRSGSGGPDGVGELRKHGNRYLVAWRLDDGSQGGKTVDTPDEARDLAAEKRLEVRRGTWRGRQPGWLPFSAWAAEWWKTILEALHQLEDAPWADWYGHPLRARELANLLRACDVRPRDVREHGTGPQRKGYTRTDLYGPWARYVPRHPRQPRHDEPAAQPGREPVADTPGSNGTPARRAAPGSVWAHNGAPHLAPDPDRFTRHHTDHSPAREE